MGRLVRMLFILIASLAGAVAAVRWGGAAQPAAYAVLFSAPDGTPCPEICLFGARPGQTSFAEALEMLQMHPITRGLRREETGNEFISTFWGPDFEVRIGRGRNSLTLAWITLLNVNMRGPETSPGNVNLGEALNLLGTPTVVQITSDILTDLYYPARLTLVRAVRAGIKDSVPIGVYDVVYSIYLYEPAQYAAELNVASPHLKAWRGFMRVGRYRNLPIKDFVPQ